MCGICGIIGDAEKKEEVLERMMQAIRHRGPDGGDAYLSRNAALGFRRLSIIDLEQGMQPMYNETGSKVLLFNGEIYNYRELREELLEKGHIFRSETDSEVLLHGYEEYGIGLLHRLRGMFSFAVWDEEREELFAARDFFGIKPFYYTEAGQVLVFASEIKSILEYPGYERRVNEAALEQYLSFQYSVLPETFFKGIYQLPPGHFLHYKNGRLQVTQYFKPELLPGRKKNRRESICRVRQVMERSVDRHLVSDVKVGCFLSGGVDSGFLTAVSGCDETFTVGFRNEGSHYDETGHVKELAEKLQIENHRRYITKEEFKEALPKAVYYLDEPLGDPSAIALWFLAQEASQSVKVVLSGEGSDELFGGYNIYLEPDMLRYIQWLPKGIRERAAAFVRRLPGHFKGKGYLIRGAQALRQRYIGNAYIFHPEEKQRLLKHRETGEPEELLAPLYDSIRHLQDSDQMQCVDINCWLPGDILKKADRMGMAHSLEVRVPFLDMDVFEVARRLPHRMKFCHGNTKYALRKAAGSVLPKEVSKRRKLGFPIPIRCWLREEEWYQQVRKAFAGETAERYFHREYLLALLEEHKTGKEDHSRKIWTVYSFLLWHQIYFEGEDREWSGWTRREPTKFGRRSESLS